jgi:hypothetical protein
MDAFTAIASLFGITTVLSFIIELLLRWQMVGLSLAVGRC